MDLKVVFLCGTYYKGIVEFTNEANVLSTFIVDQNEKESIKDYYKNNINCSFYCECNSKNFISKIIEFDPSIIISLGWRKILKSEFFEAFNDKLLINIHPAILPDYKGYHTEPYIIFNNESEHGVTAHFLTKDIDAGNIILQKRFFISEYDTVKSIKSKVNLVMPLFINELFERLLQKKIISVPQTSKEKIIAPKRNPDSSLINPEQTLRELYHFIRGCDPDEYPAYFVRNDGIKVYIKLWTDRPDKESIYEL